MAIVSQPVASSNYVSVAAYSCESNTGVEVSYFNVDCVQCAFGSKASISVQLTASQDQTEQVYANVWLTKAYVTFLNLYSAEEVNICGATKSVDGAQCPAAGTYEITTDIDIPAYSGYVTGFQAHAVLTDSNGNMMLQCYATITAGTYYQMYFTGAAAVCGITLLGLLFGRRKWTNDRVSTEGAGHFEMMQDSPSVTIVDVRPSSTNGGVIV